jgi:hypothetical protein
MVSSWGCLSPAKRKTLPRRPTSTLPSKIRSPRDHQTNSEDEAQKADKLFSILGDIQAAIRNLESQPDPEKDKRNEDREKADLKAQEDMAFWAKTMFWATAFSLLISAVGLVLIWRSLKLAREAIHAEKRPWLDFEFQIVSDLDRNDTDHYPDGLGFDLQMNIQNHGASPALNVEVVVEEMPNSSHHFFTDFDLTAKRNELRRIYSKSERPSVTVFPNKTEEVYSRFLISSGAVGQAVPLQQIGKESEFFIIRNIYIIAIFYRSPTSSVAHETSMTGTIVSRQDGGWGLLKIRKDNKFRIPVRSLNIQTFAQKRAN